MKRISMALTATAILAATAIFSAPAQAGGVKVTFGNSNHKTVHSHKQATHHNKQFVVNHSVCKGYYTTQAYQYWVNGYWDQQWIDTSRWVVDGLTSTGQANYVWVTDGYWQSYWVNGYWATGYTKVWVGDGCYRCRMHH